MVETVLCVNYGFAWYKVHNVQAKGYAFTPEGRFLEKENLSAWFQNINSKESLIRLVSQLDGHFSVVIQLPEGILAATDTSRIFPLFWISAEKKFLLSDDPYYLRDLAGKNTEFNASVLPAFLGAGYVPGSHTLLKDLFQIPASGILSILHGQIYTCRYYSFAAKNLVFSSVETIKVQWRDTIERTLQSYLKSCRGKTLVIPLSGGYDSRLLALMAKKTGFLDTVCFTYGRPGYREVEISKQVAQQLGFKWYFIPHVPETFGDFTNDPEWIAYIKYAGKLSSMPYMQEYFAVRYLKRNHLIPDESVFLPGHSGDLLGGSQLIKVIPEDLKEEDIPEFILKKKFPFYPVMKEKKNTLHCIQETLTDSIISTGHFEPWKRMEDWDVHEKIAKLICNSSSVFLFFGYKLRFPYWNRELMNFSASLSFEIKAGKKLYNQMLEEYFFHPYGLMMGKNIQPHIVDLRMQKLKNFIKKYFPAFLKKNLARKNDWIGYHEITSQMLKDYPQIRLYGQSYNSLITQWYAKEIMKSNPPKP